MPRIQGGGRIEEMERREEGGFMMNSFALAPRSYMEASKQQLPESLLNRRQNADGACKADEHSCQDIGFPNFCCARDRYCYISNNASKPEPRAACCAIGNTCAGSNPCPPDQFLCSVTATSTTTVTNSATAPVSSEVRLIAQGSCCTRACDYETQYQCPGPNGGCCPLTSFCQSDGTCAEFVPDPPDPVASIQPTQCAQNHFPCDDGLEGCCRNGARCTIITSGGVTGYCASATETGVPTATRLLPSNFTSVREDDRGLSTGAKAGIGVGAALAVLLIVGLTAFCILRRRRRRATEAARSETASTALQSGIGMREFGPDGTPTPSAAQGRGRRRQGTNDYFGPQATAGPYTEGVLGEGEVSVHGEGVLTPGLGRPVPVSPQGPGDIVPAVEMEASERRGEEERVPEYERVGMGKEEKVPETTRDRFELP